MLECLLRGNSLCGVTLQHLVEKIQAQFVDLNKVFKILGLIDCLLALRIERQLLEPRPVILVRCASNFENLLQLLFLVLASEKWLAIYNFSENAPNRPNID